MLRVIHFNGRPGRYGKREVELQREIKSAALRGAITPAEAIHEIGVIHELIAEMDAHVVDESELAGVKLVDARVVERTARQAALAPPPPRRRAEPDPNQMDLI